MSVSELKKTDVAILYKTNENISILIYFISVLSFISLAFTRIQSASFDLTEGVLEVFLLFPVYLIYFVFKGSGIPIEGVEP